ncbi:hypothetical protein JG687_00012325 [Phytophthora cactorum]|uniref:Uncharacterized protein n=2 Tax=Phytophthora cactorum TaxID=29920 RepID=A0A8T1U4M7_9STRA|nr:hypothetical protein JG687_00012325 [Phytophthora cactorum]
MWTSAANRGYTVVTLHRIDPGWHLRSVILGFKRVEYPHSGPRLADHLLEVVTSMDSALLRSMWAITTDNASNNNAMIVQSAIKLRKPIEELLRRIRDRHDGYTDFSIPLGSRLASCIPADTWSTLEAFCQFLTPVEAARLMAVTQATSRYTKTNAFVKKMDAYAETVKNREAKIAAVRDPPTKTLLPKIVDDMNSMYL